MCKETKDVLDWTLIIYSNKDNKSPIVIPQSILSNLVDTNTIPVALNAIDRDVNTQSECTEFHPSDAHLYQHM